MSATTIEFPYINPEWEIGPIINRTTAKDVLPNSINIQSIANTVILPYTNTFASTVTFDLGKSNYHILTLSASGATLALTNVKFGMSFAVDLIQDGTGSRTVTWFSTIKWPAGGTAPTLTTTANRRDVFVFKWIALNSYNAFIAGKNLL